METLSSGIYPEFLRAIQASELIPVAFLPGPITDPVAVFLMILAIMLVAPLLFERLRLPGIMGLILAGVVVDPNGLGLLAPDETIVLLGTVGLLFLMFMAGLETSLNDLKYNAHKAAIFGLATFAIPMVLETGSMLLLGYSWLASILVASCFATHTLLALPILTKLGIMRSQAVTATLGGTLITNVLGLLVLAVVVKAHAGNLTLNFWLFLIPALAIYTFATLWGVPKLGRWFFRQLGHDESAEFIFAFNPESVGLSSETPVSLVRGNFVRKVSQMLQMDDLLILTAHTQPNSLLGLPGQLVQPEAIARIHPDYVYDLACRARSA